MNFVHKLRSLRLRTKFLVAAILSGVIWILWSDEGGRQTLYPPNLSAASSQPCIEMQPEFGPYQEAVVRAPGLHCVATDFWQQRLYGAGHSGPASYRSLISIDGGNVIIDLMSHTLHSAGHSSGITAFVRLNMGSAKYSKLPYGLQTTNITVKNGIIDLRGLGTGVEFINRWNMFGINEPVPTELNGYEKSKFVLENLLIKTDNVGVILEGDGNIIRNCVIESGGNAAIMMAGPNGQIINNTIVLTNPFIPASMAGMQKNFTDQRYISEFLERKKVLRAAIALHQATGTVISGNRIEVKGKSATRHNIYISNGSKDVRVEGNTIVGTDAPVTLLDGSTVELKNNVFEKKKVNWWTF